MQTIPLINVPPRNIVRGLKQDNLGYIKTLIQENGPLFSFDFKPRRTVVVMLPEMIQHILSNDDIYIKGTNTKGTTFNVVRNRFGESTFITDDKTLWALHRKGIIPNLMAAHYSRYADTIAQNFTVIAQKWDSQISQGKLINFSEEIPFCTLENLLKTLIVFEDESVYRKLLDVMHKIIFTNKAGIKTYEYVEDYDNLVKEMIRQRLNSSTEHNDVIAGLLSVYQNQVDDESVLKKIRDELKGLLIAGHDTLAATMTWACYLLAKSPEKQELIKQEANGVVQGGLLSYEDIKKLPYTAATLQETLRLFPPIYYFSRLSVQDDIFNNILIPKGSYILIPIYHLQRSSAYWESPEEFKPERFLGNGLNTKASQAYMPFGYGLRACIGRQFAAMEGCVMLALLLTQYQLSLPANYQYALNAEHTLWPKNPLLLSLKPLC